MIYQATLPPAGAPCDRDFCATDALVRVIFPRSGFDADGSAPAHGTWDSCDLHWPEFRDATVRNGHRITDTTGDPRRLLAEFPGWQIFRSDLGRLYAARPGVTVYGWLTAHLRTEILACQFTTPPRADGGAS